MTNFYAIPMAVADTDAETIVRAMEWQDKIQSIDQDIGNQTMVVLEFLVLVSRSHPRSGITNLIACCRAHRLVTRQKSPCRDDWMTSTTCW